MRKRIKKQPFFSLNRSKTYKSLRKGRNAAVFPAADSFPYSTQWWQFWIITKKVNCASF